MGPVSQHDIMKNERGYKYIECMDNLRLELKENRDRQES